MLFPVGDIAVGMFNIHVNKFMFKQVYCYL